MVDFIVDPEGNARDVRRYLQNPKTPIADAAGANSSNHKVVFSSRDGGVAMRSFSIAVFAIALVVEAASGIWLYRRHRRRFTCRTSCARTRNQCCGA